MTIAFDAQSTGGSTTGDGSWTHTPAGTPRGAIVLIVQNVGTTDEVIGVTYGGVTMGEVALSPLVFTAEIEDCVIYGYFLGASVPTGAQTVAVDVNGTGSTKAFAAITVTAASDTAVHDTSTMTTGSDTTPSVTMTVSAETVAMGALFSGNAVVSAIAPGSAFTQIQEHDFGGQVCGFLRSTSTHSASNYDVDWTSSLATLQAVLAVAVRELAGVSVVQVTETDLAQPIAVAPRRLVAQVTETDAAGVITAALAGEQVIPVVQAMETDLAQAITFSSAQTVNQVTETDLAQPLTAIKTEAIGQAQETDLAQPIRPPLVLEQVRELDRAQQIALTGGLLPISDAPVLIRAPRKAGRIFHEIIAPSGEGYHPSIGEWTSEEDAPGGFRGASGIIKSAVFGAHREVFQAGSLWRTFLEDGTCIFAGRLKQPDPSGTVIQLSADGRAVIADREVGPILYQAHVGSEVSRFFHDTDEWSVTTTTLSHNNTDTAIVFKRSPNVATSGQALAMLPFFGRDIAFMRFHMTGRHGLLTIQTRQRNRIPDVNSSAELSVSDNQAENYYFNFTTSQTEENVEVDLVAGTEMLPDPNSTLFTNVGPTASDTGWGFVWPDLITIEVADWASTPAASETEIVLSNIEINGAALGSRRRYSVGDLVEDIAARLGFGDVNVGGSYDITPYELPPGVPASEALDWACLLTSKRYRILDTGSRATFEFDRWDTNVWTLASPWSPLRTIPEERYDAVSMPYSYPGTHGQLTDMVTARVDDSPLSRRKVFRDIEMSEPSHNRDKAEDLGMEIAELLLRPRASGDFAAAEVIGADGEKLSAHHVNAGDIIRPQRRAEPGALRLGRLTRFEDHVEGEFDGERKAIVKLLARREKTLSKRKG